MSTPKPGQIRCPTCLRSTPPAAFCTQCGSPIPPSARARPRGLDREELDQRIRRRPGENAFRRGGSPDDARPGYVPFEPEPEDALAARGEEEAARHIDNLPPEPDVTRPVDAPLRRGWSAQPPPATEWPAADTGPAAAPTDPEPEVAYPASESEPEAGPPPDYAEPAYVADERAPDYPPEAYDDTPYGRPEDAYAYPYQSSDDRRGGGGSALPIVGFVVLCVLALAVGAVLAGLLGGDEPVGRATSTPSPSVAASEEPSQQQSQEPSVAPSESGGEATPRPSDGPVAFSDGALLTIQPCGSNGYRQQAVGNPEADACQVDGSSVTDGRVWAFIVFSDTGGSDTLRVRLIANGQTENEQELTIDSVLNDCGDSCGGLIYGATYQGLIPGEYELELLRNGDFADRASFTVEG